MVVALGTISHTYSQLLWPTFGWLLRFPIQRKPSKLMAPSLSLFQFFSLLYSTPQNDEYTSSPTHSAHSRLFFNASSSTAEAIVRLVVALTHRIAATQARYSASWVVDRRWH
jgi:hypothetical protein